AAGVQVFAAKRLAQDPPAAVQDQNFRPDRLPVLDQVADTVADRPQHFGGRRSVLGREGRSQQKYGSGREQAGAESHGDSCFRGTGGYGNTAEPGGGGHGGVKRDRPPLPPCQTGGGSHLVM